MRRLFLFFLPLIAIVRADDFTNPFSLEYLTDSSSVIVVGTLKAVSADSIELNVAKTLKSEAESRLRVSISPSESEKSELAEALKDPEPTIWFLVQSEDGLSLPQLHDRTYGALTFAHERRRLVCMTQGGFHYIAEIPTVEKLIEHEVADRPGVNAKCFTLESPRWLQTKMVYPDDERAESLARGWLVPGQWQFMADFPIDLLSRYPSGRNKRLLQAIAELPRTKPGRGDEENDYRGLASELLRKWGVAVPQSLPQPHPILGAPVRLLINGREITLPSSSRVRLIGESAYGPRVPLLPSYPRTLWGYFLTGVEGIKLSAPGFELDMPVGSRYAWLNGDPVPAPLSTWEFNHELYFPIRFVTERLGGSVSWNIKLKRVEIVLAPRHRDSRQDSH